MADQAVAVTGFPRLWDADLRAMLDRALIRGGDDPAVVAGEAVTSYRDLGELTEEVEAFLAELGVGAGDRVVVHLGNTVEYLAADLALVRVGAVKVPVNQMLTDADIVTIVECSGAAALLLGAGLALDLGGVGAIGPVPLVSPRLRVSGFRLTGTPAAFPFTDLGEPGSPTAPAVIYFTGGTTGRPKGVVHPRCSVVGNLLANALEGDVGAGERVYLCTPLSHSAGLFAEATLLRGGTVYLDTGFDPERFLRVVHEHRIGWTFMVPTMIYRLLDHLGQRRPDWSLRTIVYGAAPIGAARLRQAIECFGPVMIQLFGQTECPNWATALTKEHHRLALDQPDLLESAGRPTTLCSVGVRDEGGTIRSQGTGEICLAAPYVMAGYYDDVEKSATTLVDGWLLTGDIGSIDERGFVYLRDRRADMIISGGMNVYTIEVETALFELDGVTAAAVIGLPDPQWGEAVHAVVVVEPDSALTEDVVREHCRDRLSAYKRPKSVEFVGTLPLTPFGKVDKKQLRAERSSPQATAGTTTRST